MVKIVIYVPKSSANKIREILAKTGCGKLGNYDSCSFSTSGTGRFRPLSGSKPYLGKQGKIEKVEEERIETICPEENVEKVILEIKKAHPYEEPAIDIYPLLNDKYLKP